LIVLLAIIYGQQMHIITRNHLKIPDLGTMLRQVGAPKIDAVAGIELLVGAFVKVSLGGVAGD
jgi:hypothetical protein